EPPARPPASARAAGTHPRQCPRPPPGTQRAPPRALAELHKRITETDQRLNRLFDAIESGVADLDAPGLKERIAGLKAIREQATAGAERAQAALDHAGNQAVSPDMVRTFARTARQRMRLDSGGYRRDHLRALAQRVEVADTEVRIMGSKSELAGVSPFLSPGRGYLHRLWLPALL